MLAEAGRIARHLERIVGHLQRIIAVGSGPGQEFDDVVEALKRVHAGKAINYQGASSTCDFHAERRSARPRHGAVDCQGRQEPVRGVRQAMNRPCAHRRDDAHLVLDPRRHQP